MNGQIRRAPALAEFVPVEEVRPLVEKLMLSYETQKDAAERLVQIGGGTIGQWQQALYRISTGRSSAVKPATDEAIRLALGLEPRPPAYRQQVWRVSGFDPWDGGRDRAPRTWFYIREKDAHNRRADLQRRGLFIEWAVADATWKELA